LGPLEDKFVVAAIFESYPALMGEAILHEVVRLISERFVEENYASLVSKLDQQAIANLAVADSGKKIAEEIRQRPVVYRERGNTTTNYSIF
jgi:hypothetical protein